MTSEEPANVRLDPHSAVEERPRHVRSRRNSGAIADVIGSQPRADCVAKLFAAPRESNDRIHLNGALNQRCVSAFALESSLVVKIDLQHNRPEVDMPSLMPVGVEINLSS
jgi:hypothetical protein